MFKLFALRPVRILSIFILLPVSGFSQESLQSGGSMSNQHANQTETSAEDPSPPVRNSGPSQYVSEAQAAWKAQWDQEELTRLHARDAKETQLKQQSDNTLDKIVACFDILPPFNMIGSHQGLITMNTGLKEAINKVRNEHPDFVIETFEYPLSIQFADGTTAVISGQEQFENLVTECISE